MYMYMCIYMYTVLLTYYYTAYAELNVFLICKSGHTNDILCTCCLAPPLPLLTPPPPPVAVVALFPYCLSSTNLTLGEAFTNSSWTWVWLIPITMVSLTFRIMSPHLISPFSSAAPPFCMPAVSTRIHTNNTFCEHL